MNADQLSLPMGPFIEPAYAEGLTIAERFDAFHAANPWIADTLEEMAAEEIAAGFSKVGVKNFVEAIRWHHRRTTKTDRFKINNDFTSRYARLLIGRHPEWASAIETRELRAA